jgi:hypothetical protein
MSAVQFQRQLGLTRYETAFGILHKLRAGMVRPDQDRIGGRVGEHVEVDETYVGGKTRGEGRCVHHRTLVSAAVEIRHLKPGNAQDNRKDGRYAGRVRLAVAPAALPNRCANSSEAPSCRGRCWSPTMGAPMADLPPISRTRGLACVPFGLLGRDIAESRVDALSIIVAFDVGEQVASGFVLGGPSSLVNEFHLEGVEEAFHWGVIITTARSAHGRYGSHAGELLSIGLGRVLAAAIRVTDETGSRSLPLGGHH